jgi:hypothetical protein
MVLRAADKDPWSLSVSVLTTPTRRSKNVVLEASSYKEMKFSTVEWPIDVIHDGDGI